MRFIKESGVVDGKVRQTFRLEHIDDSGFIPAGCCEILDVVVGFIGQRGRGFVLGRFQQVDLHPDAEACHGAKHADQDQPFKLRPHEVSEDTGAYQVQRVQRPNGAPALIHGKQAVNGVSLHHLYCFCSEGIGRDSAG